MTDHPQPSETLIAARVALIGLRQSYEMHAADLASQRAGFEAAHAILIRWVGEMRIAVLNAEQELKALALVEYKRTGNAKPIDGVEIKIFKVPEYSEAEAMAWARESMPALFHTVETFNADAYVGLIKAGHIDGLPGRLKDDPRPQVSKKLEPIEPIDEYVVGDR